MIASHTQGAAAFVVFVAGMCCAQGDTIINFEGLPDSTILTNQYSGLTFTNTIILFDGISLNQFEFPPYSGTNVVQDNGMPLTIDFANPITGFGGYFAYLEPLTLAGFDASDTEVATAMSARTLRADAPTDAPTLEASW